MRKSSLVLAGTSLALALSLAACGGAPEQAEETPAAEVTEAPAEVAASDAAMEPPVAEETAEPEPEPTPTPTPTPTKTAEPKKEAAAAPEPKAEPVQVAELTPPASFNRCAVCHTWEKGGENKLGPNLWGTYGKQAGFHAGFKYSDAMKDSGVTWDDATLNQWLENPRKFIPGNRMSFPGLKDEAKRQEIIDFLKKLK
ncbi:c-type cytochrome [Croceicoccus sediminis]|uniref:c-type cytochrome n=1 Tax=Croceicoccus sediminis TaxID=2571150 RepID=UPI00118331E5|nr:cytochrome c family protein [Croceicoccus sediminis]